MGRAEKPYFKGFPSFRHTHCTEMRPPQGAYIRKVLYMQFKNTGGIKNTKKVIYMQHEQAFGWWKDRKRGLFEQFGELHV